MARVTSGYSKVVVDRRKFGGLVAVWDRRNRAASTLSDRQETTEVLVQGGGPLGVWVK